MSSSLTCESSQHTEVCDDRYRLLLPRLNPIPQVYNPLYEMLGRLATVAVQLLCVAPEIESLGYGIVRLPGVPTRHGVIAMERAWYLTPSARSPPVRLRHIPKVPSGKFYF